MSWSQVRECAKYGELGVHSWAHPHLAMLSNKQIISDTKKAINAFRKYVGYVPKMYAYPYGEYDKRVKKIINRFFPVIANQNVGAIDDTTPINDLDRIAITGKVNFIQKLKIKRLHLKSLKIKRIKNKIVTIFGELEKNYPYVGIYITKFGWKKVAVKNRKFEYRPNFEMQKYRTRVIISYNYKIISKLLLKEE
jgi:peptidoglycan/xylan/chitin deacetylase (PgdA/CDA1 family)